MTSETLSHHDACAACRNCGAATAGNYCQHCGQATHLHVPSAREFLHEFIAHYVALEGKLWKSLGKLIARPGFLTREYIEGRRVRYLEPLRLYLTFSIIFFAIFKLSNVEVVQFEDGTPARAAALAEGRLKDTLFGPASPKQAANMERAMQQVVEKARGMHPVLGDKVAQFAALTPAAQRAAFKQAFYSYTPYAIFAMLPLFALYLKILYLGSGRRYGEHFLFGLHTNAFAFLMLSVMVLLPTGWDFVRFILTLWLLFYLPIAMRRVYGGSRLKTWLRWLVLIFAHVISLSSAVMTVMGQVLLA
ncbi:DUF3667 domain-containing protein [Massilia sp. YIM B02443]|uniref:DUF3667 domain-containing protein n=1 Tax=Massilia sp. YIM B02443 TaxID=3050127 RepID=UPI0025B69C6A